MLADCPPDWSMVQWHVDPGSLRYRSRQTATRACKWLNSHKGEHDVWLFRPGLIDSASGRVLLERRWVGGGGLLSEDAAV
jgi:hypothetical protein